MNIPARLRASLLLVLSVACADVLAAQTASVQPANRISAYADRSAMTRMTGHLPRWVAPQADAGAVPDETPMRLSFLLSRSPEREMAFTQLLIDQQNPSSPRYRQWLTPAQIGEEFGPSTDDVATLTQWMASRGMQVTSVSPSRIFIEVSSTTGIVAAALSTSFHNFIIDGETHLSATTEPAIPTAFSVAISAISGLTDVPMRAFHTVKQAEPRTEGDGLHAMYSGSGNTLHYVFPGDFAKIYDVNAITGAGFTGTGVKVAIIGRSQIAASDITQLEGLAGLPSKVHNVVLVPGADPGLVKGDQDESTLDVGRVLTTSTGAQADLVIAASASGGISAAIQYNVQTLVDPVMTISYGACESRAGQANVNAFDAIFQQGAAEGISTFVSSGDSVAAGCSTASTGYTGSETRQINYLCSSSYVTCVGGTQFNDTTSPATYWSPSNSSTYTSALGYIPEGAWNEPVSTTTTGGVTTTSYVIFGTGGGPSLYISKPSWQNGTGVPVDSARDTPDVSFSSSNHDGYYSCLAYVGGDCSKGAGVVFAGTSAAAPSMAAVAAILNQKAGAAQGNLNPVLYALAASTPNAFHDATPATSGVSCAIGTASTCNNSTPGASGLTGGLAGYPLQVGYDLSTGLGSLDVTNYILAASGPVLLGSTTTLAATPTTVSIGGSAVFTATVTGSGSTAATGTVQFYSNGTTLGSPVTIASGKASTPATPFPTAGTYSITAIYSGDTNYAKSTSPALSFVVTPPATTTTITASPSTILSGRSAVFTATVAITSGTAATGTVQFYSNGTTLGGPITLTGGTASTPATTFTTPGTYVIRAIYSGDANNATSTSATLNFIVNPLPATTTTVTAAPAAILVGRTVTFTAAVAYTSGTAPTGTVQFASNNITFSAPVTLTGGTASVTTSMFTTAGTYTIAAAYSGDSNNAPSTGTISFVVAPLPSTTTTVTAVPATVAVGGSAVFTATVAITGSTAATGTVQFFQNGAILGSPVAIAAGKASTPSILFTTVGTYAITATYSGDTNNGGSSSAALSFVVSVATVSGLTATATPSTLSVAAGATSGNTSTIALATTASYYGSVTMSCSVANSTGTIYLPTCTFAPASVTFAGTSSGSSVLTLATTVPHAQPGGTQSRNNSLFAPIGGVSLAGLLLWMIPSKRRRKVGWLAMLPLVLLGANLMAITGCGSGGSPVATPTPVGTTKGAYTVTVTATPGAGTAATTTVTLTVQ